MIATGIGADAPIYAVSHTQSLVVNAIFGVTAALALVFCVRAAIRARQLYPLFLFLGGTIAVYYEFLTDILGRCMWVTQAEPGTFAAFGRELPLFAITNYMTYFPVACVTIYGALSRGITYQQWWKWVRIGIPLAFVFELYPVHAHWWFYYGEGQPLAILGLPLYWSFCAVMAVMCTTAASFLIVRHFVGERRSWVTIFTLPLGVVGFHMAVVFPVHATISSTNNLAVTTVGALVTIALTLSMLALMGQIVVRAQAAASSSSKEITQPHLSRASAPGQTAPASAAAPLRPSGS